MAKKFAEITGLHKIFSIEIIDDEAGNSEYKYNTFEIDKDKYSELDENIGENTIIFVTADEDDVNKIIGPNNYKISKDDCFIVSQNKVYATFGKVNVSDVMGPAGKDGETPEIGENGNWFIGGEDTGFPSRGEQGPQGDKGDNGKDGENGETPEIGENGNWFIGGEDTGFPSRGENGAPGENGAGSVPDLMGFENTQYEGIPTDSLVKGDYGISKEGDVWVYDGSSLINKGVNLKGPKGDEGEPGQQGPPGESSGTDEGTTEIKDLLPIGAITMYAGASDTFPLDGWLLCNGAGYEIKSISTINIPGHGPDTDGEELFTTTWGGNEIKWQISDKISVYVSDLLKIIKGNYGMENPRSTSY